MARNFHRRQPLATLSEINVTPMLDLAFSLLIIFMITTPFLEQAIPLNLPVEGANAQTPPKPPAEQVISVDAAGQAYWGRDAVDRATLDARLGALAATAPETVIHLRADAALPYQRVVDLLELLKMHGLSAVRLDTQAR